MVANAFKFQCLFINFCHNGVHNTSVMWVIKDSSMNQSELGNLSEDIGTLTEYKLQRICLQVVVPFRKKVVTLRFKIQKVCLAGYHENPCHSNHRI